MTAGGELLLFGGRVRVLDPDRTLASSVLFRGGRVAAVGDDATAREDATDARAIDLEGRTVLPGFIDAHTHLFLTGLAELGADLGGAGSLDEVLDRLRSHAATLEAGEWVLGYDLDEDDWHPDERRLPTRADLDAVSEDHPVAATRVDGHAAYVNSLALEALDLEGVEGDVRTDGAGRPTGVLVEDAAGRVRRATAPDVERSREALARAVEMAHARGITSVGEMAALSAPAESGSPLLRALFDAWRSDELGLRVTCYVHADKARSLADLEIAAGFGDEWLRIGGVKRFADGSLGAGTAKLAEPYVDEPDNRGEWVTDPDELAAGFRRTLAHGGQLATHALGDEAIDAVLDGYAAAVEATGVDDARPRIEHVELATDAAIERMAELGVVASMQPNFLRWDGDDSFYARRLGPEAAGANNRFADVLAAGVTLAFGSDCMPMGPLYGIHHAVNSPHEAQRLTVDEAVAAYTRGSARAVLAEAEKGTLEPGMLGDAVVLEADPYEAPERIEDIGVAATVVGGELVFEDW